MFDIDLKHPLEQTRPTNTHSDLGKWHSFIPIGCITFVFLVARNNLSAQFGIRSKRKMEKWGQI
jgi:hypothetical protein